MKSIISCAIAILSFCMAINDGQTTAQAEAYTASAGSLKVTITPQGAIDAGAKWRRVGTAVWLDSGTTETAIPVGQQTLEFGEVAGWAKPGYQEVTVNVNWATLAFGTYTTQTGSLQVAISPQGAIAAGAQWRVDGGVWHGCEYVQTGLSADQHIVEFSDVAGWAKPGNRTVPISDGQTTTTFGAYAATVQSGSMQVTINPQAAIDAGALWRVDGGAWQTSGYTQTGLAVGQHTVDFSDVTGWIKPGSQTVTINAGPTTTASGEYRATGQTGSLQVRINPQTAIDAGAKWRRVGTAAWLDSGTAETGIPVGQQTLEFSEVAGWAKPGYQGVTINRGLTTLAFGAYTTQTGSLQVAISPQGAIAAGAQWRVDGGVLHGCEYVQTGLSADQHIVEFSDVAGWTKPDSQTVPISNGQTTTAIGAYSATVTSGSLQVTISPQAAIDAGALWRADGEAWQASGYTQTGLAVGQHTVDFSDVAGWRKPGSQTVTIGYAQTTTANGIYTATAQVGSLQVIIGPQAAIDAGARWRVDGGAWRTSGYMQTGIPVGGHTVDFRDVGGWIRPGSQTVTIGYAQTTTANGIYTATVQTGSLTVMISPQEAVAAGAQWRRVGTTLWQNSEATESGIPVGQYDLEFIEVQGWTKPADQGLTINDGRTTVATGTYTPTDLLADSGSDDFNGYTGYIEDQVKWSPTTHNAVTGAAENNEVQCAGTIVQTTPAMVVSEDVYNFFDEVPSSANYWARISCIANELGICQSPIVRASGSSAPNENKLNGYFFYVVENIGTILIRYKDGIYEPDIYTLLEIGVIETSDRYHTYGIEVSGTDPVTIRAFIDDELKFSHSDSDLDKIASPGRIGFITYVDNGGEWSKYDDFSWAIGSYPVTVSPTLSGGSD